MVCNARSLFPKISNFKNDILERNIDVALVSEVWENSESHEHQEEITKMLELDELSYISCSRPNGQKGGGVAIIANSTKFSVIGLNHVKIPLV